MPALNEVQTTSYEELLAIFRWSNEREDEKSPPITVLIGGWAVYAYNRYYGSVDIDLVTNSVTRRSLVQHLKDERGFLQDRDGVTDDRYIYKAVDRKKIEIDFINRVSDYPFEGNREGFSYSILDGSITKHTFERIEISIPRLSTLICLKTKAAWDRAWRINNGRSRDAEWERGKLEKDRADILALLAVREEHGLDIGVLGDFITRYPFLKAVFMDHTAWMRSAMGYELDEAGADRDLTRFRALVLE